MARRITGGKPTRHELAARVASAQLFLACIAASGASHASFPDLLSLAIRSKVSEERVLGKEQPLSFHAHDLAGTLRLPWNGASWAGWDASARLLASAGVLRGAGHSALVVSALPTLALARQDVPLTLEFGAGLALLGRHDFPEQDYGGALQFALTFGVSVPVWRRIGIGYRFMHYSDAGAYGPHSIGADFHMVELVYRFR